MPHHSELLEDMSKGAEPGKSHCRDQEGYGEGLSELIFEGAGDGGSIKRFDGGVDRE